MAKHCLVTGGAGFIGSHLIDQLLKAGNSVTAVDNLSTGSLSNLHEALLHPNFKFVQADASDFDVMEPMVSASDELYHFASMVGVTAVSQSASMTILNNLRTIETLYQLVIRHKPKFILSSTSEIYGQALSFQENPHEGLREDSIRVYGSTHINRWSYSGIKAIEEFLTLSLYQEYNIHAVIVRFFNVTGSRQCVEQGMVMPRFIHQAFHQLPLTLYGDGLQQRCFTAVQDAVFATMKLMETPLSAGEAFNIGGIKPISMKELAETIIDISNTSSKIEYVPSDVVSQTLNQDISIRIPNVEKLRRTIGFVPNTDIRTIISNLLEEYTIQALV